MKTKLEIVARSTTKGRIYFRVSPEEEKQLDRKRFEEGTTWQALGYQFFMEWLNGKSVPTPKPEAGAIPDAVAEIWNHPKNRVELGMRNAIAATLNLPEMKDPKPK